MDLTARLLTTAVRHCVNEPTIEAAYTRFGCLAGGSVDDAVAACLRDRLIREPVRLPGGALQCHRHRELTSVCIAAARALLAAISES